MDAATTETKASTAQVTELRAEMRAGFEYLGGMMQNGLAGIASQLGAQPPPLFLLNAPAAPSAAGAALLGNAALLGLPWRALLPVGGTAAAIVPGKAGAPPPAGGSAVAAAPASTRGGAPVDAKTNSYRPSALSTFDHQTFPMLGLWCAPRLPPTIPPKP